MSQGAKKAKFPEGKMQRTSLKSFNSGHSPSPATFSSQSLGGGNSFGRCCRPQTFSSRSLGGGASRSGLGVNYKSLGRFGEGRGIHTVRINPNLLQPLRIQIDPEISRVKEEEREQIKTLNNKFVSFIDKVRRYLEQQNKLLETKWNCLQQQEPVEKANIQPLFDNYIIALKQQLQRLLNEREQLQLEQSKFQDMVEEFKNRYEKEINHRLDAENNFVLLKKVRYSWFSKNLQEANSETSVVVSMDNSRALDMEGIIHSVRSQYEEIAQRSKDEVNALYENKYKELQNTWGHYCSNLSSSRHEIQELTRLIQRCKGEVESSKKQIDALQTSIADNEQRGESALKDARLKLTEVENNLQSSKDELARLLRDYQNLLNLKIPLDIEIAMYKSLLEGEENSLSKSSISSGFGQSGSSTVVPSTSKNSDVANVGSSGSYSSKSRGYSSTNTTHISATTGVSSKGGSGGISVSGSYNIQSSGGYSGDDYSSHY
uniref:IF rod domain-containing protein n=1 Tax=Pseudonaja textilis TaxID=8673 RepID=A0A670Z4M6_PSETE